MLQIALKSNPDEGTKAESKNLSLPLAPGQAPAAKSTTAEDFDNALLNLNNQLAESRRIESKKEEVAMIKIIAQEIPTLVSKEGAEIRTKFNPKDLFKDIREALPSKTPAGPGTHNIIRGEDRDKILSNAGFDPSEKLYVWKNTSIEPLEITNAKGDIINLTLEKAETLITYFGERPNREARCDAIIASNSFKEADGTHIGTITLEHSRMDPVTLKSTCLISNGEKKSSQIFSWDDKKIEIQSTENGKTSKKVRSLEEEIKKE
jgi:hypothetical protein